MMLSIAFRPLDHPCVLLLKIESNRNEINISKNNASYFSVMPVDDPSASLVLDFADWVSAHSSLNCDNRALLAQFPHFASTA